MTTKTIDLLAIGNPCIDLVIHTDRVPAWDDKCIGRSAGVFSGGTEANVACAASRLGLATALFGQVGTDGHAWHLLDDLKKAGVDSSRVIRRAGAVSATTVILVSPTGERSIVWVPMAAMPPAGRAGLQAAVEASRIAYTMPYDLDELAALDALAIPAGTQVAIDIEREGASKPGVLTRLLQHCDIAFMNQSGFTTATGQAPSLDRLRALLAIGRARTIVVTMGARGALAVSDEGEATQAAFAAEVVDTTGAGDSFNAAFLAGRAAGVDLQHALAWGCAAASKVVASIGARTGSPTRDEVLALVRGGDPADQALSAFPPSPEP